MKLNRYILRFSIAYILFLLSACQTASDSSAIPANSLQGNPKIPQEELRPFYTTAQWYEARKIPYDGYVIFRVKINHDDTVTIESIEDEYPDSTRTETARQLASTVRLSPYAAGSRAKRGGEVFVVFYETYSNPNKALVFGKQSGAVAPGLSIGGNRHMSLLTY